MMKMLFRPVRGGLQESMGGVIEITSRACIIGEIKRLHAPVPINIAEGDLAFRHLGFDARINWDTYLVFTDGLAVHGYTNCEL